MFLLHKRELIFSISTLSSSHVTSGYVDVSKAIPETLITAASALSFHELTKFNPSKVHVAIPYEANPKRSISLW